MDELLVFLETYGWQLALIALAGVIILGILKYCKVFDKFEEKLRHFFYLLVSVGISIVGSIIYLACVHQLDVVLVFTLAGAIFALNQAFYTIYDTTSLRSLLKKIWTWIKSLITSGKAQEIVEDIKDGKLDGSTEGNAAEEKPEDLPEASQDEEKKEE